jgi:hypothetical protein
LTSEHQYKEITQGLANYPHARKVNNMLYISGISSRNKDGTWRGVAEKDGQFVLDIKEQTRAVIEKSMIVTQYWAYFGALRAWIGKSS